MIMVYETFPRGWKSLNGAKKGINKGQLEHSDPETTTSSEIL